MIKIQPNTKVEATVAKKGNEIARMPNLIVKIAIATNHPDRTTGVSASDSVKLILISY
jgi:hypothetical protein